MRVASRKFLISPLLSTLCWAVFGTAGYRPREHIVRKSFGCAPGPPSLLSTRKTGIPDHAWLTFYPFSGNSGRRNPAAEDEDPALPDAPTMAMVRQKHRGGQPFFVFLHGPYP
jgi:hypothetical protein